MRVPSAGVHISADSVVLDGLLGVPPETRGLVLFAHDSGSSRLSPRNTYVARALRRVRCEKRLTIVSGASHLFEEPGTLDEVVRLATDWFGQHLGARPRTSRAAAPRARR
jgi:hypothetical protein